MKGRTIPRSLNFDTLFSTVLKMLSSVSKGIVKYQLLILIVKFMIGPDSALNCSFILSPGIHSFSRDIHCCITF